LERGCFFVAPGQKGTVEDKSRCGVRARVNAPLLYNKISPSGVEAQSC
jgi:hypothetical protein